LLIPIETDVLLLLHATLDVAIGTLHSPHVPPEKQGGQQSGIA
jgi:hypothetical protein